jgi:cell division transport system permease protein
MKLVGATNWFIRVPFILEGVAEALVGATVASAVIYAVKALFLDPAQQHVPWIPLTVGIIVILKVFLTLSAVGVVIGAIGSSLALRRFLEV